MIIVELTYKQDLKEVDKYLEQHKTYLDKFYNNKKFLFSGAKPNRVGGVIIMLIDDINEANMIIKEDPFYINRMADYRFLEFNVSKHLSGLNYLFNK